MTTIPLRQLRNQASDVVRRAEQGERFTITVNGRPAADLGPVADAGARDVQPPLASVLAATPVDDRWREELRELRLAEGSEA